MYLGSILISFQEEARTRWFSIAECSYENGNRLFKQELLASWTFCLASRPAAGGL
jgi:hypothetical protein